VDVDSLYQDAMRAFAHEDWLQAVIAFEKIQVLQPNYRDVIDRLAQARAKLLAVGKTGVSTPPRTNDGLYFYVGGALAALVVLPLLGSVVLSPAARARIYLLRGDYIAAAQLYEKVLERHPNKVKLYPMLANIYLLLGRNDKKALKAYKMVLQLNLATRNRDEINALVAQNYLLEGRTDWDAIEVLENALKAERRRLGQGQR
jgi:tetratricopeptide (TPR) repeat protein